MRETRWIKQKNDYSCGPICIMNVLKWMGKKVSYLKNYKLLGKKCKTDYYGTSLYNFKKVLYSIRGLKIKQKKFPDLDYLKENLKENAIIVMKSAIEYENNLTGHYFIISSMSKSSFFCINAIGHKWISFEKFKKIYLNKYNYYCYKCGVAPYCWVLNK